MKKRTLIFATILTAFCLTVFGYQKWSHTLPDQEEVGCCSYKPSHTTDNLLFRGLNLPADTDLLYKVDSRFGTTITKEKLHNVSSVLEIVPSEARWSKRIFSNMKVAILQGDEEIAAMGEDEVLNAMQIALLQSADYSTNFYLNARGKDKEADKDGLNAYGQSEYDLAYYFTVVPEKEACYSAGYHAMISYLKENSKAETAIIQRDQLKPCRLHFTITKEGNIADVKLESTSGYTSVDDTLVELLSNMPGKWNPASNSAGEKVDQELVFFFGLEGC